jgi:predicted DNA-binding transcriptional regulator AlpA
MSQDNIATASNRPLAVTSKQAAAMLSVSYSHFREIDAEGILGPSPIRLGKSVRWDVQELADWMRAGSPNRDKWRAMRQTPVT